MQTHHTTATTHFALVASVTSGIGVYAVCLPEISGIFKWIVQQVVKDLAATSMGCFNTCRVNLRFLNCSSCPQVYMSKPCDLPIGRIHLEKHNR